MLGAPIGFVRGCSNLVKLDIEEVTRLVESTIAALKEGNIISDRPEVKAISYISRSRDLASPKPNAVELASALDANTVLNREIIAIIATALENAVTVAELV